MTSTTRTGESINRLTAKTTCANTKCIIVCPFVPVPVIMLLNLPELIRVDNMIVLT